MLLDSGAEISIVDIAFARKVGCVIDANQKQDSAGIEKTRTWPKDAPESRSH